MSRHFSHVCFQPSARSQKFLTLWFLCWKKRRVFEGNLFRSYGIFCGQCWNPSGAGHKKSSHTHDHLFVRMYKCVDVHEASCCCCCCWRSCRWNHLCCTGTIDLKGYTWGSQTAVVFAEGRLTGCLWMGVCSGKKGRGGWEVWTDRCSWAESP